LRKRLGIIAILLIFLLTGKSSNDKPGEQLEFKPEYQARHQIFNQRIPDDISFAGEKVHFKSPDAYKKFERELRHNTANNSSTRLLLKNVRVWLPEISRILIANKVPEDFKYLAVIESNLNNVVSPRGACGFWQITDITAIHLNLEVNDEVDERYHPIKATKAACRYFKESYREFGNWTSAAAAYNRGIGGLRNAYRTQNVVSYYDLNLNDETSRYMFKVLAVKDLIVNPGKYGMKKIQFSSPSYTTLVVESSIEDLEIFASENRIDYHLLKEYNPWLLKNSLTIKEPGKTYTLLIPKREQYLFKNEPFETNTSSDKDSSEKPV
jgi:membrane-bound lytic murein transglycosylase D